MCRWAQNSATGLLAALLLWACSVSEKGYLLRVVPGEEDEFGAPAGYVDANGDTIVAVGAYFHCYTDTLRNHAIVLQHDGRCLAINREGEELYDVYWVDNGPDPIAEGYFRILREGLVGYANVDGAIVIEPQFACAFPFDKGRAQVAFSCTSTAEGEHSRAHSGSWFWIDKNGNRL